MCLMFHPLETAERQFLTAKGRTYEALKDMSRWFPLLLLSLLSSAVLSQDASRFEKEVLVAGCSDPLQMDIAADGRVFFIERKGAVKMWEPV